MSGRMILLLGMLAVAVLLLGAQPVHGYDDKIGFWGMDGSPGETNKCLEIFFENSQPAAGLQARFEFDPDVLSPVFDPVIGDGESVVYELVGRAVGYSSQIVVKSWEPGVLNIRFLPPLSGTPPTIPVGSGPIMRVYFDVLPGAPPGPTMFAPVNTSYDYNAYSDPYGNHIWLVLVKVDFNVVALPYVPGDANSDGRVNIGDVVYLNNYLRQSGPPPNPLNAGDPNADCEITIDDSNYIVAYIFKGGPAPQIGCVECDY